MSDSSNENAMIGMRIREERKKRGMSQQEIAVAAGLSLPHISVIELGKSHPKVESLVKIAEALQVSTDTLLRPNIPAVNAIYQNELQEIIGDCSPAEVDAILKIVREVKSALHAKAEQ